MPCIGRIVHRASQRKSDGHSEVSEVGERAETEDFLELLDGCGVVRCDQAVEFGNDVVDSRRAVGWTKLLDWIVPFWVGVNRVDDPRGSNSAPDNVTVLNKRESCLGTSQTATVHDPWACIGSEVVSIRHILQDYMLGEIGVISNGLLGGEITKLFCCGSVERVTVSIVAVLEDYA